MVLIYRDGTDIPCDCNCKGCRTFPYNHCGHMDQPDGDDCLHAINNDYITEKQREQAQRITFNKLIRDNMPAIIAENGDECEIVQMEAFEYRQSLLAKLVEEAQEAAATTFDDRLIEELADLLEVVDAILSDRQINFRMVIERVVEKKKERGGFKKRLKLVWATKRNAV